MSASTIPNLIATRDGYLAALAADALNPQPSYSQDGKAVSRNEWRKGLMDEVIRLNKIINQYNPYIVSTVMR